MTSRHKFDIFVVGAGSAGLSAAVEASTAGAHVGIVAVFRRWSKWASRSSEKKWSSPVRGRSYLPFPLISMRMGPPCCSFPSKLRSEIC